MTTYAQLINRDGAQLTDAIEINNDSEFDVLEQEAIELGKVCAISWRRTSDGQSAYWTPRGTDLKPHWYNAGQPPKPEHLKKRPIGVKLSPFVLDWLDAQDTPKAQLIEQAVIKQYKLIDPNK